MIKKNKLIFKKQYKQSEFFSKNMYIKIKFLLINNIIVDKTLIKNVKN